jgi:hypothetical protein
LFRMNTYISVHSKGVAGSVRLNRGRQGAS